MVCRKGRKLRREIVASYFYCIERQKLTTNLEHVLSIMPCNIKTFHPSRSWKENVFNRLCLENKIAKTRFL